MERAKKIRRYPTGDPAHKSRMITIKVSEEEYLKYKGLADKRSMTLSELIRTGLSLMEIYR